MNRSAVVTIAIACMAVAVFVGVTDMSHGGQAAAFGIGMVAAIVLCFGIISEQGGGGSTRGDTTQHVNVYVDGSPQPQQHQPQPAYFQPPPAAPQVVFVPMPQHPQYLPPQAQHQPYHLAPPQHYAPQHQQGYLAPPMQYPAVEHHQHQQTQYRGAIIDVGPEPVRYAQHPQQVRHGQTPRLESPEASFIRRVARRIVK